MPSDRADEQHRAQFRPAAPTRPRVPSVAIRACAVVAVAGVAGLAACGNESPPTPLPASGTAYRALDPDERLAVAEACRDRVARRAQGIAARQLRDVNPADLRDALDDAFALIALQRKSVERICAERIAFVTPGLRVAFAGARDNRHGSFSYETVSDKRLTIRGRVSPPPQAGHVRLHRELGAPTPRRTKIDADGRFAFSGLPLRKVADNSFTLTIEAPPNAPRKVHFSAICLDCLAGGPPPSSD